MPYVLKIIDLGTLKHPQYSIPVQSQSVRFGYPPKPLDINEKDKCIIEAGIKSGETLIVEGKRFGLKHEIFNSASTKFASYISLASND